MNPMSELASSSADTPVLPLITDFEAVPSILLPREHLDRRLIVGFEGYDDRSRPFNLLRTRVAKTLKQRGWRMIGVTSATPAAGKTFNAVNLAAALSKLEDQRILLCDFDLRRASILQMLGIGVPTAINEYLDGTIDDCGKAVYRINNGNLYIMPVNEVMRDSSETFASSRFLDIIARLRAMPENCIVICDLPPVFANDDTMLCMEHLDGFLLVVDHGQTTARQLEESIALLRPTPCLGTILNRYQGGFADDYGYGYGDPYGLKSYGKRTSA